MVIAFSSLISACARRACRTGIAALRDDAVAAAHVRGQHLHFVDLWWRENKLAEQAFQLFETTRSQQLPPEVITYFSWFNACAKGELAGQALQLFRTRRLQQLGEAVAGALA